MGEVSICNKGVLVKRVSRKYLTGPKKKLCGWLKLLSLVSGAENFLKKSSLLLLIIKDYLNICILKRKNITLFFKKKLHFKKFL